MAKHVCSEHDDLHPVLVSVEPATTGSAPPASEPSIIWTPGFIVLCVLVLVVGLCVTCLLTQGLINGFAPAVWGLPVYVILNIAGWLMLYRATRHYWVRLGCVFGVLWGLFTLSGVLPPLHMPAVTSGYLGAAGASAWLGATICLSSAYPVLKRWDVWFLRLAPLIAIIGGAVLLLRVSGGALTPILLASGVTLVALCLNTATWWLRPSCWRVQPGPTFLFGLAPLVQLLAMQPDQAYPDNDFLFMQLALLLLLLAMLRMIQAERRSH